MNTLTTSNPLRSVLTVLILDIAGYTRLMEEELEGTEIRWSKIIEAIRGGLLTRHEGHLVESRGDSLVLTFAKPQMAVRAAFDITKACEAVNLSVNYQHRILLRMGIHQGEVFTYDDRISGHTVNLASRLMTSLAKPGEIVVSASVRDDIVASVDAEIDELTDPGDAVLTVEDLGANYLKNIKEPVRAYRLGPPGPPPAFMSSVFTMPELRPTIAVIPFGNLSGDRELDLVGDVLADEVVYSLSKTSFLNVTSRLSTSVFKGRDAAYDDMRAYLQADYILWGRYHGSRSRITISAELVGGKDKGSSLWNGRSTTSVDVILKGDDAAVHEIIAEVSRKVVSHELRRGQTQHVQNLEDYSLLVNAIVRMHRNSIDEFNLSHKMLEELISRDRRLALPHAWLAKWYVLRHNRGWSEDRVRDTSVALDHTKRALDSDEDCALAWTVSGFVQTHMQKCPEDGLRAYEKAIELNPNESLAWLFKGTLHAFKGEGQLAVEGTERALKLSPLDPLRYFYESLAATAAHCAGHYERAVELSESSLRSNRLHSSTWRSLAVAQVRLGRMDDARLAMSKMRMLEPELTVRSYLTRHPSDKYATGKSWAEALRSAGLPD